MAKNTLRFHAITFSTNDIEKGELVCTTRTLNKYRSMPGYVEYDYAYFGGVIPKHIQNSIIYTMEKIGDSKFDAFGFSQYKYCKIGKFGDNNFGYIIYKGGKIVCQELT